MKLTSFPKTVRNISLLSIIICCIGLFANPGYSLSGASVSESDTKLETEVVTPHQTVSP